MRPRFYPSMRNKTALVLLASMSGLGAQQAGGVDFFSNTASTVTSISAALSSGTWSRVDGDVALSSSYVHDSAKQSYRLSYPANESQAFLGVKLPSGKKHVFLRWWELRERAGDFSGAKDYDWSAEKTVRFRSASIGSTGVDYCLGWEADSGQRGTSGTDGPGDFVIFGNSSASNGSELVRVRPKGISRGEWNMYEVEINLGTVGQANGATRIWVNDVLVGEKTNVVMLPSNDASIEEIWIGGWYSGLSPSPSPARRYIDDVVVADQHVGGAKPRPKSPTGVSVD
jgi:hypothetical protein